MLSDELESKPEVSPQAVSSPLAGRVPELVLLSPGAADFSVTGQRAKFNLCGIYYFEFNYWFIIFLFLSTFSKI